MRVTIGLRAEPHRGSMGVVLEREVPSSSDPELTYFVRLHADGRWSCSCRGYRYTARDDGLCKHIDQEQEEYESARELTFAAIL